MSDARKNPRDIVSFWLGLLSLILLVFLPLVWASGLQSFQEIDIQVRLIIALIISLFILIPCVLANEQFNQIAKLPENNLTRGYPIFGPIIGIAGGILILIGWVQFESNSKLTGIEKNWLLEIMSHFITSTLVLPTMMSVGVFLVVIHLSSIIRRIISDEIIEQEESNFEILKWADEYPQFLSQDKVLFDESDKARKKQLLIELKKLLLKKCKVEIHKLEQGNFNFEEMYRTDRKETFEQLNRNYNWPSEDMSQVDRFLKNEFRSAYISKLLFQYLRLKFDHKSLTTNFTINESIQLLKMFVEFPKPEDYRKQHKRDILSEFVHEDVINSNINKIQIKLRVFLNLVYAQYKITYDRSRVGNIVLTEKPLQLDIIETIFSRMSKLLNLEEYRFEFKQVFEFEIHQSTMIHVNELGLNEIREDYSNIIKAHEFTRLLPFQENEQEVQVKLKKLEKQLSEKLRKIATKVE